MMECGEQMERVGRGIPSARQVTKERVVPAKGSPPDRQMCKQSSGSAVEKPAELRNECSSASQHRGPCFNP
jgi:hypothetical protein